MSAQFQLSETELDKLYVAFLAADVDGNGTLDYAEFYELFKAHVHTEDQVEKWFTAFDRNKDGTIDIKEFTSALTISLKGTAQQKLEALFNIYDINKDQNLSPDEIITLINHLKKAVAIINSGIIDEQGEEGTTLFAKSIVDKLDINKDGNISLEEWTTRGLKTPALLNLLGLTPF